MSQLFLQIREELKQNTDQKTKDAAKHFFKETINVYGVNTALVGNIAKKYWQQIKGLPKKEIFGLCEELYQSGVMEESLCCCKLAAGNLRPV